MRVTPDIIFVVSTLVDNRYTVRANQLVRILTVVVKDKMEALTPNTSHEFALLTIQRAL